MRKPLSTYEKTFIREHLAGMSYEDMATALGRTPKSIKRAVYYYGYNQTEDFYKLHNTREALTIKEYLIIKNSSGTPAEISRELSRPHGTIWNAMNRA